jgi:integrase
MHKGVRYHRSFAGASKDEVAGFESIAKAELRKNSYDITSQRHDYTLSELIADYEDYRQNNYSRPDEFKYVIDRFYKIVGNKIAEQITTADIEKYRLTRKGKVKNSTINREVDNIKRIFSLAVTNKKIRFNPCNKLKKLRQEKPPERYLTKDEEKKLMEAANPIMQALIITALLTGMRTNEILNLKWADVHFDKGYIVALNTKNGKPRRLLLSDKLRETIDKMPRLCDYVFANPLTKNKYSDIKSTFSETVKRAKIPHITFHQLRHTAASRMNEKGVDIVTIKEILDHSDLKTTQKYTHTPRKNVLDAVKVLEKY